MSSIVPILLVTILFATAISLSQASGVVSLNVYPNTNCVASAPYPIVQNYTTGACTNQGSSSSEAWYFDSSNVYLTQWYGSWCNGTIKTVFQIPKGCSTYIFGLSFTSFDTSDPLPFITFPPSGFTIQTIYSNVTSSGAKATSCSIGNGVVATLQATNPGCVTRPTSSTLSQPSSTAAFCNSAGTIGASVVFSDLTCTNPAAASAAPIQPCQILDTVAIASNCDGRAILPSSIPSTGYIQYTDSACTARPITQYIGSSCFDGQTLVCGPVNGTSGYATFTSSLPLSGAAAGTCGGTVLQSETVLAGWCVPNPGASGSRMYFCGSIGPSAGSSTGTSGPIGSTGAGPSALTAGGSSGVAVGSSGAAAVGSSGSAPEIPLSSTGTSDDPDGPGQSASTASFSGIITLLAIIASAVVVSSL